MTIIVTIRITNTIIVIIVVALTITTTIVVARHMAIAGMRHEQKQTKLQNVFLLLPMMTTITTSKNKHQQ